MSNQENTSVNGQHNDQPEAASTKDSDCPLATFEKSEKDTDLQKALDDTEIEPSQECVEEATVEEDAQAAEILFGNTEIQYFL